METNQQKIFDVLKKSFKLESFRTSQERVINNILSGNHSLVLMPTGMGKSLCYQLPAVMKQGLTVVISPLISLMKDQVDSMKRLGLDAVYINSSLSKPEREGRYRGLRQGKYKIILVSPERFRKQEFLESLTGREISFLAVDEAHCISQWGHDFRPDYSRIKEFRGLIGNPVTIALTATATKRVQLNIIEKLGLKPGEITIFNEGICRPNLSLEVQEVIDENEKFEMIYRLIKKEKGSRIVLIIKGILRSYGKIDARITAR